MSRKITFYMPALPSKSTESIEVDEDTTNEEIEEIFNEWVSNFGGTWWEGEE